MSRRTHLFPGSSLSWNRPANALWTLIVLLAIATLAPSTSAQRQAAQAPFLRSAIPQIEMARRMEAQRPAPIRQVLVKFKTAVAPAAFARAFSAKRLTPKKTAPVVKRAPALTYVRSLRQIGWHLFQLASPSALPDILTALRRDPAVLYAEPNQRLHLLLDAPTNPKWGVQDAAHTAAALHDPPLLPVSTYDTDFWTYSWYLETVHALDAWAIYPNAYPGATDRISQITNNPAQVPRVAILDTGIDFANPAFAYPGEPNGDIANGGQIETILARKIVGGTSDNDPMDAQDTFGHGTSVAGLIGSAPNNGQDLPGLGFVCRLVPIKIYDDSGNGTDADLASAIMYATDAGCLLINVSARTSATYTSVLQDAVDYAWDHGSLVIAAIGNDGTNSIRRWPASLARVLAVGATLYGGPGTVNGETRAPYSDYGQNLGVVAPGGGATEFNNTATDPTLGSDLIEFTFLYTTAPTYSVPLSDPNNTINPFFDTIVPAFYGLNYGEVTGTSFATPQVTGLAALYAAKNGITQTTPNGPLTILQAIERGADNTSNRADGGFDLGTNTLLGTGYGRINAAATLQDLNNRNATVGGIVGLVKVGGLVQNSVTVTAQQGSTTAGTAKSTEDGVFHLLNLAEGDYVISATVNNTTYKRQVHVTAGCDAQGIDLGTAIITITPNPAAVFFDGTLSLFANVTGLADTTVSWSVVSGGGSIDQNGVYTAPGPSGNSILNTAVVQATSNADSNVIATQTIFLLRGTLGIGNPIRSLPTPPLHSPGVRR